MVQCPHPLAALLHTNVACDKTVKFRDLSIQLGGFLLNFLFFSPVTGKISWGLPIFIKGFPRSRENLCFHSLYSDLFRSCQYC